MCAKISANFIFTDYFWWIEFQVSSYFKHFKYIIQFSSPSYHVCCIVNCLLHCWYFEVMYHGFLTTLEIFLCGFDFHYMLLMCLRVVFFAFVLISVYKASWNLELVVFHSSGKFLCCTTSNITSEPSSLSCL